MIKMGFQNGALPGGARGRSSRGSGALIVIAIIAIMALAGVIYYLSDSKAPAAPSAIEMGKFVPAQVYGAKLVDLRSHDIDGLVAELRQVITELPDGKEGLEEFETNLGLSLEQLLGFFEPRGYTAVLTTASPEQPGVLGVVALADAQGFEAWLAQLLEKEKLDHESREIEGVPFRVFEGRLFLGHDDRWLFIASAESDATAMVNASHQRIETLEQSPRFQEVLSKYKVDYCSALGYLDLAAVVNKVKTLNPPYTDDQTWEMLAALDFVVGSADFHQMRVESMLGVKNIEGNQLSEKLLTKGSVTAQAQKLFSGEVSSYNAFDVQWLLEVLVTLGQVSPGSRTQASMVPLGMAAYGNPWGALDGEFAACGNTMETMVSSVQGGFGRARGAGQHTACKSNLKNIATACEMWSVDHSGHYPENMAALTPNYLRTLPTCPAAEKETYSATYSMKSSPDYYEFHCQGDHHGSGEEYPAYNAVEGLNDGGYQAPAPPPSSEPSGAIVVRVQDMEAAARLVGKLSGQSSDPPAQGESKELTLPLPGAKVQMINSDPPRVVATIGPQGEQMLSGGLAARDPLKQSMQWGQDGIVYVDYLDLDPAYQALVQSLESDQSPEAQVALGFFKRMKSKVGKLEGSSCVTVTPEGVRYRGQGFSNGGLIIVGSVGAAILVPNFIRARGQGQMTACKSNLKNIGTGLEMWSTDYSGEYPETLDQLTPNYLRAIPTCPAAGEDTYSAGYSRSKEKYYEFYCGGHHHRALGVPGDYPRYNGLSGLIER